MMAAATSDRLPLCRSGIASPGCVQRAVFPNTPQPVLCFVLCFVLCLDTRRSSHPRRRAGLCPPDLRILRTLREKSSFSTATTLLPAIQTP